jgi:hypothetical protein
MSLTTLGSANEHGIGKRIVAAAATLADEGRAQNSPNRKKPPRGPVLSFLSRRSGLAYGLASLLLAALLWELAASQFSSLIIAPLSVIWASLVEMAESGELWTDLSFSGQAFLAGFLLSAVFGVLIGMVTATN